MIAEPVTSNLSDVLTFEAATPNRPDGRPFSIRRLTTSRTNKKNLGATKLVSGATLGIPALREIKFLIVPGDSWEALPKHGRFLGSLISECYEH